MFSRILCAQHPVSQGSSHLSTVFACDFSVAMQIQYSTSTPLYSSRLYAQNPVFEIVHEESVKVCLSTRVLYNGNVQQNPLCAASCATIKDIYISPLFSPLILSRDANSVLLRAQLCTAVGSMRKTLCSKLFMRRASRVSTQCVCMYVYLLNCT